MVNKAAAEIVVMDNRAVRQTIAIRAVMRVRGAEAAAMANKAEVTKSQNLPAAAAADLVVQEEAFVVDEAVAVAAVVAAAVAAVHTAVEVAAPVEVAVSI